MKPQFSSVPMEIYKTLSDAIMDGAFPLGWTDDVQNKGHLADMRRLLKQGKHFELPPRGFGYSLEDEKAGGLLEKSAAACKRGVRLPYPVVTIGRVITEVDFLSIHWELDRSLKDVNPIAVKITEDEFGDGFFTTVFVRNELSLFVPCGLVTFVKYADLAVGDSETVATPIQIVWVASMHGPRTPDMSIDDGHRAAYKCCGTAIRDVIDLNVALSSTDTKVVLDRRLSGIRAKVSKAAKHKSFYEIHRVVIDTSITTNTSEHKGGTHASPRWHTRRGYWRTMKKSGKVVWVQACEVGKKSDGMVYKDYEVVI